MCDQGPAGLVNGYALTSLDRPRIDQITDLINQQKPLEEWPREFFQVKDNIIKPGLLLSQSITQGSALQAAYKRGLTETLAEIDISGLRGRGGAGYNTAWKWELCCEGPDEEAFCDIATHNRRPRLLFVMR